MRSRDRLSVVFGALALTFSVAAIGGAPRTVQAVLALLVLAAVVPQLTSRRGFERVPPLLVLIATGGALTALQLVPLPSGLVEVLSPVTVLRDQGTSLVGADGWSPLSLDPAGTALGLVYFAVLAGSAFVSLRIASSAAGRRGLIALVAFTCGLAAVIAGAHEVLGLRSLYGIYEPVHATPQLLGPLLNPNHFGGLMAIGTVLSVGLIVEDRLTIAGRAKWLLNGAACITACLATLSRGAVLAMAVGFVVTVALVVAQKVKDASSRPRRAKSRLLTTTVPVAIVVSCLLFIVVYTSADRVVSQLENTTLEEVTEPRSKFAAWRASVALVREAPLLGIGRGAVEPALTRVHPASAHVTFSHLENEYVQTVVEYGVLGAAALALCAAWLVLAVARRRGEGAAAAGAIGALVTAAVHNTVDFGAQLLGYAVPLTVLAAALTGGALSDLQRTRAVRMRIGRSALVALLGLASALAFSPFTRTLSEDHQRLALQPTHAHVREVVERHPLDYYSYAIAADLEIENDPRKAVQLLNHALLLHPNHIDLHRMAARMLLKIGLRSQAMLEYGVALRGTRRPAAILKEVVATFSPGDAARTIPIDYMNIDAITRAVPHEVSREWLALVLEARPRDVRAADALFEIAWASGDLEKSELAARRRAQTVPSLPVRLALARVLAKRDKWRDVANELTDVPSARGHARKDELAEAWMLLCEAYVRVRESAEALRCLHLLDGTDLVTPEQRTVLTRRVQEVRAQRATPPP